MNEYEEKKMMMIHILCTTSLSGIRSMTKLTYPEPEVTLTHNQKIEEHGSETLTSNQRTKNDVAWSGRSFLPAAQNFQVKGTPKQMHSLKGRNKYFGWMDRKAGDQKISFIYSFQSIRFSLLFEGNRQRNEKTLMNIEHGSWTERILRRLNRG